MMEKWDLIVIGGGAAGFFCAVNAARLRPGLKVCLLEKSGRLLSKVAISGGGRCNVTHACFDRELLSGHYPRGSQFLRKAFHDFYTKDTIEWYKERGVDLKTEADGRMFPVTDQSSTIVNCLLREASEYQVDIQLHQDVKTLMPDGSGWLIETAKGRSLQASAVCAAIGGMNKGSLSAIFQHLDHSVTDLVPSLFTFNMPGHDITGLMGISVEKVTARIPGTKLESAGPLLITHWGMSGPAILKLSAWGARELAQRNYNFSVQINWLPSYGENDLRAHFQQLRSQLGRQVVVARNSFGLPQRLWEYIVLKQAHVAPGKRWADLSSKEQNSLIRVLLYNEYDVKGKTTFREEFVTAGGVALSEIDHRTMQSRKHPGLYFAGEVMDADGITGGFNFQHAWTSGYLAARAIAGSDSR